MTAITNLVDRINAIAKKNGKHNSNVTVKIGKKKPGIKLGLKKIKI